MRKFIFIVLNLLALKIVAADLNVVAVGDTGKGNSNQFIVGTALAKECQQINCQFALLLGDNIYDKGIDSPTDQQMIDKFEKPYAEMKVPFYVALGNHDYGKLANDWARGSYQLEYSKMNPKYILPKLLLQLYKRRRALYRFGHEPPFS